MNLNGGHSIISNSNISDIIIANPEIVDVVATCQWINGNKCDPLEFIDEDNDGVIISPVYDEIGNELLKKIRDFVS